MRQSNILMLAAATLVPTRCHPFSTRDTTSLPAIDWTLPFPPQPIATGKETRGYLEANWNILNSRLFGSPSTTISFVADPLAAGQQCLAVSYPPGSFALAGKSTALADTADNLGVEGRGSGGAQFYIQPAVETGWSEYHTASLLYDVAFHPDFEFVKGGKLPGWFGGSDVNQCSGGVASDGGCFSLRVMWRTGGAGEVYAYLPATTDLCTRPNVLCNDDGFGSSLSRGSFSFTPGRWTSLNLTVSLSLGLATLAVDGNEVLRYGNLSFGTAPISYATFSTFFGGSDPTWASAGEEESQVAYFRNIRIEAPAPPALPPNQQAAIRSTSSASCLRSPWLLSTALLLASFF